MHSYTAIVTFSAVAFIGQPMPLSSLINTFKSCCTQKQSTVRRPPSQDYKPRRSESEDPTGKVFTAVKTYKKPDGTVVTETTKTIKVRVQAVQAVSIFLKFQMTTSICRNHAAPDVWKNLPCAIMQMQLACKMRAQRALRTITNLHKFPLRSHALRLSGLDKYQHAILFKS